jgi:hypothetical protein
MWGSSLIQSCIFAAADKNFSGNFFPFPPV